MPILDGRVHEQVSSVLFFTVFFEGERHDLSKTGGFCRKNPGKPVTFYECHPEDRAPAPSVRADFGRNSCFRPFGWTFFVGTYTCLRLDIPCVEKSKKYITEGRSRSKRVDRLFLSFLAIFGHSWSGPGCSIICLLCMNIRQFLQSKW